MHGSALRLAVVTVVLTALCACGRTAPARPVSPGTADDVAIFKAILKDACEHPDDARRLNIVRDVPRALDADGTVNWLWSPPPAFIAGLVRRSATQVRWPKLAPCATQRVIDGARVDALIEQSGKVPPDFAHFRQAFPNAGYIIAISLPAYSADGRRAMVLRTYSREGVFSAGEVLEMELAGTAWRPVQVHSAWVSVF